MHGPQKRISITLREGRLDEVVLVGGGSGADTAWRALDAIPVFRRVPIVAVFRHGLYETIACWFVGGNGWNSLRVKPTLRNTDSYSAKV